MPGRLITPCPTNPRKVVRIKPHQVRSLWLSRSFLRPYRLEPSTQSNSSPRCQPCRGSTPRSCPSFSYTVKRTVPDRNFNRPAPSTAGCRSAPGTVRQRIGPRAGAAAERSRVTDRACGSGVAPRGARRPPARTPPPPDARVERRGHAWLTPRGRGGPPAGAAAGRAGEVRVVPGGADA